MPPRRTVSGWYTFYMKFFYPAFSVPLFPLWVQNAWLARTDTVLGTRDEASTGMLLIGLLFAVIMCHALWCALALKRVRLLADGLEISNYRRAVHVPFASFSQVREDWLGTITVKRRIPTPLGQSATFLPPLVAGPPWRKHPLVGELKQHVPDAHESSTPRR